jgi:hypothetical protein
MLLHESPSGAPLVFQSERLDPLVEICSIKSLAHPDEGGHVFDLPGRLAEFPHSSYTITMSSAEATNSRTP